MGLAVSTDNAPRTRLSIPGHGTLTGVTLANPATGAETVHRYTRVPYALPLKKRFSRALPIPDDYDYTGEYVDIGPKCPQPVYQSGQIQYPSGDMDEYIQYLNIWVPSSDKHKPANGWPVLLYIHGGWLQYGDPNNELFDAVEIMDDDHFMDKYIFVTLGYRLNIFGFLTCDELLREDTKNPNINMGFWDQREALLWTHKFIGYFGGDPEKITISGLSAGAYSAFFQLAYELYHPQEPQIIKQVILHSNMVFSQPKSVDECRAQYEEVIAKLGNADKSPAEQLAYLRSSPASTLVDLIPTLQLHTFRAVTDDVFVPKSLLSDIESGVFAAKLAKSSTIKRIIHGEVDNEGYLYSQLNPPVDVDDLRTQLENYYPKLVAETLMDIYDAREGTHPVDDLSSVFGGIVGDGQVYVSTRGFAASLQRHGFPADRYLRYRISYRGKWLDDHLPKDVDVTHAYDKPIWFYALRAGFDDAEKGRLQEWLTPFLSFLNFKNDNDCTWPADDIKKLRWFKNDGSITYEDDPEWERCLPIAEKVYRVQLE